jgi:hypothetical protein
MTGRIEVEPTFILSNAVDRNHSEFRHTFKLPRATERRRDSGHLIRERKFVAVVSVVMRGRYLGLGLVVESTRLLEAP